MVLCGDMMRWSGLKDTSTVRDLTERLKDLEGMNNTISFLEIIVKPCANWIRHVNINPLSIEDILRFPDNSNPL